MIVTLFTLLGLNGIIRAAHGESSLGWGLAALAITGGMLSKGPVILILILPPALFVPCWLKPKPRWGRWYGPMLVSILLGALLALAWAVPAGFAGGDEYLKAIFWSQTAGRLSNAFAHPQPFWWYFALLPALWLPWTFWLPLWRSTKGLGLDWGLRFCATQGLSVLAVFSLISGKRIHYLLPIFPAMALFAARALSQARPTLTRRDHLPAGLLLALFGLALLLLPLGQGSANNEMADIAAKTPLVAKLILLGLGLAVLSWCPADPTADVRVLALAMLGLMLTLHLVFRLAGWQYYSLQAFAERLAVVDSQGVPIAHWREYHGDFNFLGRLRQPLVVIDTKGDLLTWMYTHRQCYVVLLRQPDPAVNEDGVEFAQFYRGGRRLMLWKSAELLSRPETLERMLDRKD